MKKLLKLTGILTAILLLAACSGASTETPTQAGHVEVTGTRIETAAGSYTDISVPELQAMLANKDFVFVNVHIPFEGDIPGTDASIPYNEIEQHLLELPGEKDAKIVLYCRSDRMSQIAAEKLVELGYTNLYNLDGGFAAWEAAKLPVER